MSNLGGYQLLVKAAKLVGGPKRLVAVLAVGGFAALRPAEAAAKKSFRAGKKRFDPCPTRDQVFSIAKNGEAGGVKFEIGDQYRVLECDDDAIIVEISGLNVDNPHAVSSHFLSSVSAYPAGGSDKGSIPVRGRES